MESLEEYRKFLKTDGWGRAAKEIPDQQRGIAHPPVQKPFDESAKLVELVKPAEFDVGRISVGEVIEKRRSRRKFNDEKLSLEELGFLLWSTQGVRKITPDGATSFRMVPSGGSRHTFETYLCVNRVTGLEVGLYRYLAIEHKLMLLNIDDVIMGKIAVACCRQSWMEKAAVVFVWTTIPYRMEWRYGILSHKVIAIDSGHVCQNLYLASESIGAGTCGVAAYYQDEVDKVVGVDGKDEFAIYAAAVGKVE